MRELLAIVNALKHFHHCIYGRHVIIRSYHSSLKWLLNLKTVEGQLARWLTFLSAYDFTIEHKAGRLHSNADALSRRPCIDDNCKYCERVETKVQVSCIQTLQSANVDNNKSKGCNPVSHNKVYSYMFISLAFIFMS